jgi:small neutral amino acid transporter SnatA (MarC family)
MNDQINHESSKDDEFDSKLTRLFAEQGESLSSEAFMLQMLRQLQREHRNRQFRRVCVVAAVLLLAAIAAPLVMQATVGLFSIAAGAVKTTPVVESLITAAMVLASVGFVFWTRRRV